MREQAILKQIMLRASELGNRLFRNNVALSWTGSVERIDRLRTVNVGPGDVVVRNARPLHSGLCIGSSDLIGWTKGGVFTAIECKSARGAVRDCQKSFIASVQRGGGLAGIARSVEDYEKIVS